MNARLYDPRPRVLVTPCPNCRAGFRHPASMAGRKVACPTCGRRFVLAGKE